HPHPLVHSLFAFVLQNSIFLLTGFFFFNAGSRKQRNFFFFGLNLFFFDLKLHQYSLFSAIFLFYLAITVLQSRQYLDLFTQFSSPLRLKKNAPVWVHFLNGTIDNKINPG